VKQLNKKQKTETTTNLYQSGCISHDLGKTMRNPIRMSTFSRLTARLIVLVFFTTLLPAAWAQTAPTLGTAKSFAVLAAAAVSNTGSSTVHGDLGLSPNGPTSITGFPPGQVVAPGTIHGADAVSLQARNDLGFAYDSLGTQGSTANLTGQNLGGLTLVPGVYDFDSSAQLTGTLTLSGTANSVFIFRTVSTLTTASASSVKLTGGAQPCNVFWRIGSSATLGTATSFIGNILADTSITLTTGASVNGRVLAGAKTLSGAVTLDTNDVFFSSCATGNLNPDSGPIPGAGPGPAGTPDTPPVSASPCLLNDTTKPYIGVSYGPNTVTFTVYDAGCGLGSISVISTNTQPFVVPVFPPGNSTSDVVITLTMLNPDLPMVWTIVATDLKGNVRSIDPVQLTLTAKRGGPRSVTVTGIPRVEHFIDVMNGSPGLTRLSINVNGRDFWSDRLRDGESGTLDIARAMNPGTDNTITFEFHGQPGDNAVILIRPANED
jgi:hypothetical protein